MNKSDESKRLRKFALRECLILFLIVALIGLVAGFMKYREHQELSAKDRCMENLRRIDGAKVMWAQDNKKTATDTPTWTNLFETWTNVKRLSEAIPLDEIPKCPLWGTYTIGNIATEPKCSIPGHTLD